MNDVPKSFWNDRACFLRIIEAFFDHVDSDMFVYPTEFIPDFFWENEENVRAYVLTLCDYYGEDRIDFNLTGELIPRFVLKNKEIVMWLLGCNVDETLGYLSDEQLQDPEIILAALEGVENKIKCREYNATTWLPPLDPEKCLAEFINQIPESLALNRDFVLDFHGFMAQSSYLDIFDLLYKWVDNTLWTDRDFVFEVLSENEDALEYAAEELLNDADFAKRLKDELNIEI